MIHLQLEADPPWRVRPFSFWPDYGGPPELSWREAAVILTVTITLAGAI